MTYYAALLVVLAVAGCDWSADGATPAAGGLR